MNKHNYPTPLPYILIFYLIGCVGGNSVIAISDAALYATREFSAASFRSLPVANSAKYLQLRIYNVKIMFKYGNEC